MNIRSYTLIIACWLFYMTPNTVLAQIRADAGPDTVSCKGKAVKIGTTENPEYCYSWSPSEGLDDPKSAQPSARPTKKTTYTLTVTGPDFTFKETDEVDVSVLKSAQFKTDPVQKYGFDDWSKNSNHECCSHIDHNYKVAVVGETETIQVLSQDDQECLHVEVGSSSVATVTPTQPSSSNQQVAIQGVSKGETELVLTCGKDGEKFEEIKLAVYNKKSFTVGVVVVHEENDDVQKVEPGFFSGAHGECVIAGRNRFRDTPPEGDDEIVGNDITSGKNGICETIAKDTDTKSDFYSNLSAVASHVNKVYAQAATSFNFVRLADATVNFDLNRDGVVNWSATGWTEELIALWDHTPINLPSCDAIIYLPGHFFQHSIDTFRGVAPLGQNSIFIDVYTADPHVWVTAHELGHGMFSLLHPHLACKSWQLGSFDDDDNIMGYCNGTMLRKFQWDQINK